VELNILFGGKMFKKEIYLICMYNASREKGGIEMTRAQNRINGIELKN
jgi:hypothetical protein